MRISDWSSDVCSSDLQSDFDAVLADRFGNAVGGESWHEDVAARLRGRGISLRDRKSVVSGKSVSVRVDLGGRRIIKKKNTNMNTLSIVATHKNQNTTL